MTKDETLWLAGFIDGEGYIGLVKKGPARFQAQVRIGTTHKTTMEYVASLLDSPLHIDLKKRGIYKLSLSPWKPVYITCIYDKTAEALCRELLPYLHTKQEQAKLLITYREHMPRGRNQFSETAPSLEHFWLGMKVLNQRGVTV